MNNTLDSFTRAGSTDAEPIDDGSLSTGTQPQVCYSTSEYDSNSSPYLYSNGEESSSVFSYVAGVDGQPKPASLQLQKEQKALYHIQRAQYENIVVNSAPFCLSRVFMKHYGKILLVVLSLYTLAIVMILKYDLLLMIDLAQDDFFVRDDSHTN